MKKLLSIILVLAMASTIFAFSSCNTYDNDENFAETVRVSTLNGTTGFGMAKLMSDNKDSNYEFSVETDPTKIIAGLISGDIDIAALPTNAASNVFNKTGGKVQIMAINTLGVLYVLDKTGSVQSIDDLNNKTIYVPAQNPTFILKYILDAKNISANIDSTTYSTPDALRTAVVAGLVDVAVLPEPMVTIVTNSNANYRVAIDLSSEWNSIPNAQPLVQGCVVVRKEFAEQYKGSVSLFLKDYKASIEYVNANPAEGAKMIVENGIFANENVAKKALPKCNIAYMDGDDMKNAMNGFLNAMMAVAPASIGGAIPDDSFYYIP